jgi:hypothetical protein
VCCDRTVARKGGHLRSWKGSRNLKKVFMIFNLVYSSLLGTSTRAWFSLSRFVLPIHLYLLLPLVFIRLDSFSWCSLDRCKNTSYEDLSVLGFNRLDFASHIFSTDSIPWVHNWGKKGPLTTTEDLSACNPNEVWYTYIPSTHGRINMCNTIAMSIDQWWE